jgi:NADPH-dependent ferric siderophore reductase
VQRLVYALVGLAALTVLVLSVALFRKQQPVAPPPPVAVEPARCADVSRLPAALLPSASAAPLQVVQEPGLVVRIDGAAVPPTLDEGVHLLEASAPRATGTTLKVRVSAFMPVVVDVRVTAGSITALLVGAQCETCVHGDTELDLAYHRGIGDVSGTARALAQGDWMLAAQQVRAIAPDDREGPELARLIAVLASYAGKPSIARAQLGRLPKNDPLRAALVKRDGDENNIPRRQLATATARWNAMSDRFQRLTDRFASDAPQLMTALTKQLEPLSADFVRVQAAGDAIACESTLEKASEHLRVSLRKLRAMRPTDCAWQARITAAE